MFQEMKVFITCNISKKKVEGQKSILHCLSPSSMTSQLLVTICVCVFVSVCSYVHMVQSLWFVAVCSLCIIYDAHTVRAQCRLEAGSATAAIVLPKKRKKGK